MLSPSVRLMMSCVRNFSCLRSYGEGILSRFNRNSNFGNIGIRDGHQLGQQQCRMIFTTGKCLFIKADYDPDKEKKIIPSGKERELKGYFKEDFNVLGREKWMIMKYWTSFFPIYITANILTGIWVFLGLNVPDAASFAARWLQDANFHAFLPAWKPVDDMNPRLFSGLLMMAYFQVPIVIGSLTLARISSFYRAKLAYKEKNGPKYERFYDEGDYENKKPPPL